jgi:hypothetical protein
LTPFDVVSAFGMSLFAAVHEDGVRLHAPVRRQDHGAVAKAFVGLNSL